MATTTTTKWQASYTLDGAIFISDGNREIAMIQTEEDGSYNEQDEANARLMVAAPELLEALKDMCESKGNGIVNEIVAYDKAKLAIEKAYKG